MAIYYLDSTHPGIYETVDVAGYGAIGNGIVDDTAALKTVIAAAKSAGGAEIHFPAMKNFLVSDQLLFDFDNITIYGHGSTITLANNTNKSVMVFSKGGGSNWVEIYNLKINGNGNNQPSADPTYSTAGITCRFVNHLLFYNVYIYNTRNSGMNIDHCVDPTVENCLIVDAGQAAAGTLEGKNGISGTFNNNPLSRRVRIINNTLINTQDDAIDIEAGQYAKEIIITGNHVEGAVGSPSWAIALELEGPSADQGYGIIADNTVSNSGVGVIVNASSTYQNQNVIVSNNKIRSCDTGIFCVGDHFEIGGNIIEYARDATLSDCVGIGMTGGGSADVFRDVSIHDNHVTSLTAYNATHGRNGISVFNSGLGTEVYDGIKIHHNHVECPGTPAAGVAYWTDGILVFPGDAKNVIIDHNEVWGHYEGISYAGVGGVIDHNVCHDNADCGIFIFGSGSPDRISIGDNECYDNGIDGTASYRVGIMGYNCTNLLMPNNRCYDTHGGGSKTQQYGIRFGGSATGSVIGGDLSENASGAFYTLPASFGRIQSVRGYNPRGYTWFDVPASTVEYTPQHDDFWVTVYGGTVTAVYVGPSGSLTMTGLTSGTFFVPGGHTMSITYTVVPNVIWFGI